MANFIDRRQSKHKSMVNRRRFIRRFKHQLKEAVSQSIANRSITDTQSGERVTIPAKDINEPYFSHGQGGVREAVLAGNKEFLKGDHIKRPTQGQGGKGSQASNTGEGMDDFVFQISRKEFLELFFEDLELPDLIKKELAQAPSFTRKHAGFTKHGSPANINVVRSMRNAKGRHIALKNPLKKKIKRCEGELDILLQQRPDDKNAICELKDSILHYKKRLKTIPYIDEFDLRYNLRINQPDYTTKAVMFCLMDVSGSMDESKKDLAKRFFLLLYLFLQRNYEHIDVVFIRHHTTAKEVNEEEFFYSRETGGTVVSSALEMMRKVIQQRYAVSDWNIYAAQASDGDNWNADSPYCRDIISRDILPYLQYYAYIEILPRHHQSLWHAYLDVKKKHKNFAMQHINSRTEIYPVFRELFKRQKSTT